MKIVMAGLLVMVMTTFSWVTGATAETKRPFTGLYGAIGQHQSSGDFSLSHRGELFSFGEILNVPLQGSITTYEVGYRIPLGQTNMRFGVNAVLHDGTIAGAKRWEGFKSSATFGVSSDLRLSLGAEVGTVVGEQERLYLFVRAGMVASDLNASLAIDTPWGDWGREKSGGAVGTTFSVGMEYQVNNRLSVGLSASQMEFDAAKAFGFGDMGEQRFEATLKQTTFGLDVSFRF